MTTEFLRRMALVAGMVALLGSLIYHCGGDRYDELTVPPYPTQSNTTYYM